MLANALHHAPRPFVLFVDDVHLLHAQACHGVVELLASAVPEGSTIVLAGRGRLPVAARTRCAVGSCIVATAADLRLTDRDALEVAAPDETVVDTVTVRAWVDRCEGWVTGIRLLAQVAADGREHDDVLEIAARRVGEYLEGEFFAELEADQRDLLVACSVLDRFTPDLCDAVAGTSGSAETLRALADRQSFVERDAAHPGAYRVHPMVREHLRIELDARGPRAVAEAHRRAARWYIAAGESEAAMDHLIAAGDVAHAATLLAELGLPLYHAGRTATLRRWIDAIGEPPLLAFPPAALTAALLEMVAGDPSVAARRLRVLDRVETEGMDAAAAARFTSARALLTAAHARDGIEAACTLAREALEQQSPLDAWRDAALGVYGHLLARSGRSAEARAACTEALDLAPTFGHFEALAFCGAELALLALADGDLDHAAERTATALEAIDRYDLETRPTSVFAHAVAALVHHRRGDRERAAHLVALAMPSRGALTAAAPTVAALTRLVLAEVQCGFGDFAAADTLRSEATEALAVVPARGDLDDRLEALTEQIAAGRELGHFGASAALTSAERRLLPLLQTHLTREQIAQQLYVSRNTVGTQMSAIFRKLGAGSRTAAVERAQQLGML